MDDVSESVSEATRRNWERLGVAPETKRLDRRANKRLSSRRFVPVEYLRHPKNKERITETIERIDRLFPVKQDALPALCLDYLIHHGLVKREKDRFAGRTEPLRRFAELLNGESLNDATGLFSIDWPDNEFDFLGAIYQTLLSEGVKNRKGTYFTPPDIVADMISGLTIHPSDRILDPACGTGAFLLNVKEADPRNLIGFDLDPSAAMIAKTNLFVAFPTVDFEPAIFSLDFLNPGAIGDREASHGPFDVMIANPPWGMKHPSSGERFALFLGRAMELLAPGGRLAFLLPNAFLGVKSHSDIRRRVLDSLDVVRIREYDRKFSGVVTGVLSLTARKKEKKTGNEFQTLVERNGRGKESPPIHFFVRLDSLKENPDSVFRLIPEEDRELLDRLYDRPYQTLAQSVWGLGIVTGDNARKLSGESRPDFEPILTGKEIHPFQADAPRLFLRFRREELQQTADEAIYRARPKLIYRFIADRPVFAYDVTGLLTLNSANVLIPVLDGYDVKTVAAFLNSDLFHFLYQRQWRDLKVLKGNLCRLPFPIIDEETNREIAGWVDAILAGDLTVRAEMEERILQIFDCSDLTDRRRIQRDAPPIPDGVSSSTDGAPF